MAVDKFIKKAMGGITLSHEIKKYLYFFASMAYLLCSNWLWDVVTNGSSTNWQFGGNNWPYTFLVVIPAFCIFSLSINSAKKARHERHVAQVLAKYSKSS